MHLRRALAIVAALIAPACAHPAPAPDTDAGAPREIAARVPAALRLARELGSLSVSFDPAARATVVVRVDEGMNVGVETTSLVLPRGHERPAGGGRRSVHPGAEVDLPPSSWAVRSDETRYIAEVEVVLFETDVPPGPAWKPRGGRFRVLWSRTLRQAEE